METFERDLAWGLLGAAWGLAFYRARQDARSLNPGIRRAARAKIVILLIVVSPFVAIIGIGILLAAVFAFFLVRALPGLLIPIGAVTTMVVVYHRANKRIARERRTRGELLTYGTSPTDHCDEGAGYWPGPESAEERCFRLNNERIRASRRP